MEDQNPDNNWLNGNATLPDNVTFTPVTTTGTVLPEGADGYGAKDADGNLTWGGYELKIDGTAVDTSKYTVNWYQVTFNEKGEDTYSSVVAPTSGEINDSSFTTLALQQKVGANADARVGKGLTFEVISATDASNKILSKENAPVIRGNDGIIDNFHRESLAIVIGIFLHVSTTILFESSEGHKFNAYKMFAITLGLAIAGIGMFLHIH